MLRLTRYASLMRPREMALREAGINHCAEEPLFDRKPATTTLLLPTEDSLYYMSRPLRQTEMRGSGQHQAWSGEHSCRPLVSHDAKQTGNASMPFLAKTSSCYCSSSQTDYYIWMFPSTRFGRWRFQEYRLLKTCLKIIIGSTNGNDLGPMLQKSVETSLIRS